MQFLGVAGCRIPELIRNYDNGVLVPFRSADAVASAIGTLLGDAGVRRRLGAAARGSVLGLTWRATAERTLALYRDALETRARA